MTQGVSGVLAEKYSVASNLRREKMRIISGITALNLIREKRFEEADVYKKPFVEIKDSPIEEVAQCLGSGFVPNNNETKRVATEMVSLAKLLSGDPNTLQTDDIEKSTKKLVELLNVLSNISRV